MTTKTKLSLGALALAPVLLVVVIQYAFANTPPPPEDDDGLSAYEEGGLNTSPYNPDSDGDGIPDGMEVALGRYPAGNDGPGTTVNLLVFTPLK